MAPEYTIIIGLGLFLVLWYFIALTFSRYFSRRIYRWLYKDMSALGDPAGTKANWIGSMRFGARFVLSRPHAPFQSLEIMYVLESRGLMPVWLINILRGQRDLLIIRGNLRQPPGGELEVMSPDNRALQKIRQETALPWTLTDGPHNLVMAHRCLDARQVARFKPFLEQYGPNLKRLSCGPKEPHLFIALRLGNLPRHEASPLFQSLRKTISTLRQ